MIMPIPTAVLALLLASQTALAIPQMGRGGDPFDRSPGMKVGSTIAGWKTLKVYTPDGKAKSVAGLVPEDGTLVVVNGCLTCPKFLKSYPGVEAVAHDYKDNPKVRFFYLYKTLAHPENYGFVQPFALEERRAHASLAASKLKTSIPFIIDGMDNIALKAFGGSPNSEVVVNGEGTILHAQGWSKGEDLREALKTIVGETETITNERSLSLPPFNRVPPPRGATVPRAKPSGPMTALRIEPLASVDTHYVKLRAEAGQRAASGGEAELLLGFHLDPIHDVHWNNLVDPLVFSVSGPEGVILTPPTDAAPKVETPTDHDPREFILKVNEWTMDKPLTVEVTYYACSDGKEAFCKKVEQTYLVYPERDRYAGVVQSRSGGQRGRGGQNGRPDRGQMIQRMDRDGNGELSFEEVRGTPMEDRFERMDRNADGVVDKDELDSMRPRGSRDTTRRRSSGRPSRESRPSSQEKSSD